MPRHAETRLESELVTLVDVRCRAHRGGCGSIEHAGGDAIVLPRAGFFVWHHRGAEIAAEAGRALFFGRGARYRVSHPLEGGDDCSVLSFAPATLAEAFGARDPAAPPFPVGSCAVSPAVALLQQGLRRLLRHDAASSADALAIDEVALRLLDRLADAAASAAAVAAAGRAASSHRGRRARAATIRAQRELADAVRRRLAATFRERTSLAALARELRVSPFHLARVFRARAGEPIHRHRLRLRLHAALERLADGESDLTRLALSLGFASHAHITDTFRRRFGVAPARFRDGLTPSRLREMSTILEAAAPRAA